MLAYACADASAVSVWAVWVSWVRMDRIVWFGNSSRNRLEGGHRVHHASALPKSSEERGFAV